MRTHGTASASSATSRGPVYAAVLLYLLVVAMTATLTYYQARQAALGELDRELMLSASAAVSLLAPVPVPAVPVPAMAAVPGLADDRLLRELAALGELSRLFTASADGRVLVSAGGGSPGGGAQLQDAALRAAIAEAATSGRPRFLTYGPRESALRAVLIPISGQAFGQQVVVAGRVLDAPGVHPWGRVASVLIIALVLSLAALPVLWSLNRRLLDTNAALAQEVAELDRWLIQVPSLDELTGQYNRPGFERLLEQELARCRRHGQDCGIVVLELDGLDALRDQQGDAAADALLLQAAARLAATVRGCDVLARLDNARFGMLLPETGLENTQLAAERFRRSLASVPMGLPQGDRTLHLTASVGLTAVRELGADSDPLPVAEQRAVAAVLAGGDRVQAADPG